MKSVKKFTTFEELKFCENNTEEYSIILKRHNELEKLIIEMRNDKAFQSKQNKSK